MTKMTLGMTAWISAKAMSVSVRDAVEKERYLKDDNTIG